MTITEKAKELYHSGELRNIFHPEVYSNFVSWYRDGEVGGEFIPNRGTKTGVRSLAALNALLETDSKKTPEVKVAEIKISIPEIKVNPVKPKEDDTVGYPIEEKKDERISTVYLDQHKKKSLFL